MLHCKDYYDILEVPRSATEVELKKQYKRLALALHPDKNRAPKADEAFKGCKLFQLNLTQSCKLLCLVPSPAVSNAYGVLSDKEKRSRYSHVITVSSHVTSMPVFAPGMTGLVRMDSVQLDSPPTITTMEKLMLSSCLEHSLEITSDLTMVSTSLSSP